MLNAKKLFLHLAIIYVAIIIACLLFVSFSYFRMYLHEFGHVIGCGLDSLLVGKPLEASISNWVNFLPQLNLYAPQQTHCSLGKPFIFTLGGPAFNVLFFSFFVFLVLKKLRLNLNLFWPLFFSILIPELYEVFCKTDNPFGWAFTPCYYSSVGDLPVAIVSVVFLSYAIYLILVSCLRNTHLID